MYLIYPYLLYIILLILAAIAGVFIYIRFKYQFWCMQPVFHVYDFYYYLFPPGIILQDLPEKNRYCNFDNIKVEDTTKLEDYKWKQVTRFIQKHYLKNKDIYFLPKKEDIICYFTGHNHTCLLTTYEEKNNIIDTKSQQLVQKEELTSVMTSRPLHVMINNKTTTNVYDFYVYYVDLLCVDKSKRNKGIAPQVIQTHEYQQRRMNKNILISLFKREGELTGIVPLCVYNTYCFELEPWPIAHELPKPFSIVEIGEKNLYHAINFINENMHHFEISIMPDVGNLTELIKSKNLHIFIMVEDYTTLAVYIFKQNHTFSKKSDNIEVESLTSILSINQCPDTDLFVNGFKKAIDILRKKGTTKYGYCCIENISNNDIILTNIQSYFEPESESPTAYFFYNFAYKTFNPNMVCLIE